VAAPLLDAYLNRIGVTDPGPVDVTGLRCLQAAHVEAIPFENLDILMGRGVHLDLARLRDKLIAQRRGGYCFEQNTLFVEILREIGFTASPMEARVRAGATAVLPRTHMVIAVEIDRQSWLADVGFGGEGPCEPLAMTGEATAPTAGLAYRVVEEGELRVMQMRRDGAWADQYAFLPHPVQAIDLEVANWFTSTHPSSPFVRTLTAQRATRDVRYVLRYPAYSEIRASGSRTREIARVELLPLLRDVFLIELPADTIFPAIDNRAANALA
jgi:N-hydroxyarylamine O-acetyltransferase